MADRTRLRVFLGFAGACLVPRVAFTAGINALRDRRDQRPDISLRVLLNSRLPGWQPWDCPGINGQGIWSLPGYVELGICNILVNNELRWGWQVNVDSIVLQPGDLLVINNFRCQLPQVNQF